MKDFFDEIFKEVNNIYQNDYNIELQKVNKTNCTLTGLCFKKKSSNISKIFYLDDFEHKPIEFILKEIEKLLLKDDISETNVNYITEQMNNYENIKDKVILKIVNFELNKDALLKTCVYKKFLDLAIIPLVLFEKDKDVSCSVNITNVLFESYNISIDELFNTAFENTKILHPIKFIDMGKLYYVLTDGGNISDCEEDDLENINTDMIFGVSNNNKKYGATAILYSDLLEKIGTKLNGNFYIIPSSIHEILIVPQLSMDKDDLQQIIEDTNNNEVDNDEVLNNIPYLYDFESKKIIYYKSFKDLIDEKYSFQDINKIFKNFDNL